MQINSLYGISEKWLHRSGKDDQYTELSRMSFKEKWLLRGKHKQIKSKQDTGFLHFSIIIQNAEDTYFFPRYIYYILYIMYNIYNIYVYDIYKYI